MNYRELLEWMLPTGFMGSVVYWLTNRRRRVVELEREKHQVYKQLYDELKETVLELSAENREMRRSIVDLERKVSQMGRCRYRDDCPIRELPESTAGACVS